MRKDVEEQFKRISGSSNRSRNPTPQEEAEDIYSNLRALINDEIGAHWEYIDNAEMARYHNMTLLANLYDKISRDEKRHATNLIDRAYVMGIDLRYKKKELETEGRP